ncbi:RraA family protein [Fulvivirgaceae bacterium BMA12]|uniref:Putative 4-hydroxy-4-methyl-2-oxoglutarate aldolase n=1 Tax=Agaribacillus aureus TaxID=3051825 RepID=A0ABT8LG32_9BACT|nr:RraA family protein [Fulvivirgaceae bacterium BMA12]
MEEWKNDKALFELIRKDLFTAVIGDIMDKMGYLHQFLPPKVQPLRDDMMVVGRAMTVLEADTFEKHNPNSLNPTMSQDFGLMLEALDDLKEDEVYICTGASPTYALWGELMSTRAKILGAAGAVINGYSRDTKGILALNFATFSYGKYAQDQGPRGKVIDFRCPIEIEGVIINNGDIVVGDIDGVCIVPQNIEAEVINKALEKARGEKTVSIAINKGMSARESWDTYGIM